MTRTTLSACFLVAALSVLTGVRPSGAQLPEEFLLSPGRAGRLEVGTPVDEVYRMFGRANVSLVDDFREGMFSPVLHIRLAGGSSSPGISTDIREWPCPVFSVSSINVRDGRFRTKDGFGIGSTAGDLRRAHPFRMTDGEEGSHAAIVNDLQMTFALTRQGPVDQQRVTSVLIWADPDDVKKKWCPKVWDRLQ